MPDLCNATNFLLFPAGVSSNCHFNGKTTEMVATSAFLDGSDFFRESSFSMETGNNLPKQTRSSFFLSQHAVLILPSPFACIAHQRCPSYSCRRCRLFEFDQSGATKEWRAGGRGANYAADLRSHLCILMSKFMSLEPGGTRVGTDIYMRPLSMK